MYWFERDQRTQLQRLKSIIYFESVSSLTKTSQSFSKSNKQVEKNLMTKASKNFRRKNNNVFHNNKTVNLKLIFWYAIFPKSEIIALFIPGWARWD